MTEGIVTRVAVHGSLTIVLILVDALTCYGLWRNRQARPIELRCLPAMFACVWLGCLSAMADNVGAIFSESGIALNMCWGFRIKLVWEHMAVVIFLFSAYRVLFFMELATHLANTRDVQNRANLLAGRGGWYVAHRHWMDWKYTRWFFFSQGLLVLAVILSFSSFDSGCETWSSYRFLSVFLAFCYLIVIVFLVCRLKKWSRDSLFIELDLARLAVYGVVLRSICFGLLAFNGETTTQHEQEGILQFFLGLTMAGCFAISPLIRVLRARETFTEPTTLEDLVRRPSGYESFLEFLNSEFASEGLHFWNTINLYRSRYPGLPDTKARLDYAIEVAETFVRRTAVLEVNLGSVAKDRIEDTLAACQKDYEAGKENPALLTVFDEAQNEVLKLLSRDNFRRYLKSTQFARWREQATNNNSVSPQHSRDGDSSSSHSSRSKQAVSLIIVKHPQNLDQSEHTAGSSRGGTRPSSVCNASSPSVIEAENDRTRGGSDVHNYQMTLP